MGILMFFIALVAGGLNVLSRMINADLATKVGDYQSTFFNYLVGLLVSVAAMLALFWAGLFPIHFTLPAAGSTPYFTGGIIGVVVVIISNIVTTKIPALQLTLFIFVSQLGAGILLDYLVLHQFTPGLPAGGALVLAGLLYNQHLEKKALAAGKTATEDTTETPK